jgi:hypothetical protein
MHNKHVKIGESYNVKRGDTDHKVTVKGRRIEPKSQVLSFEVQEEGDEGTVFVGARHLSPLPTAS